MQKNHFLVLLGLIVITTFTQSCSTRGVHDEYFGATEQRLLTHSIDQLVSMLPENDFKPVKGQRVFVECHFIENNHPLQYAAARIKLEMTQKYSLSIVDSIEKADVIFDFFFTAIGTDRDDIGFSTPEFVIPGMAGVVKIDLISLDMYHGVSELYYFMTDSKTGEISKRDRIRSIIRTDKLALPIISIPINTLD
ncbi:MAG: hypothetical protein D3926_01410 [Desulfobacteraceae bacterium]|nr:MAG: hypothetical protein D3926_01410 [Desulfobacteraceae bacterium]